MYTQPPKCPHCGGTSFQLAEPTFGGIKGATYKMHFVTCSGCNAPMSVLSQFDPGVEGRKAYEEVTRLQQRINSLEQQISGIAMALHRIEQNLN